MDEVFATFEAGAGLRGGSPPATLEACAGLRAGSPPALFEAGAGLSATHAEPEAIEAWASFALGAQIVAAGSLKAHARAELEAGASLAAAGHLRAQGHAAFVGGMSLMAVPDPAPIHGPLSMTVVPTGDTLEVIVSHWKEGDIEPPLTLMVRDKDGQPQDLTGRTVEIIAASGAGYPPLVRREAVVAEGGDIRPGSKPGEILMPWRPGETRPGVYEVMLRVDDERSSPAQGYGRIVIERRLG